jgi:hypothetical protein
MRLQTNRGFRSATLKRCSVAVLTQREAVRLLSGGRESRNLQRYLSRNPLTANNFDLGLTHPIHYPGSRHIANGFNATALIEICEKYLGA